MIKASQAKSWADLCAAVDSEPWGLLYRVVTKRIGQLHPGIEARGMETDRRSPVPQPTGDGLVTRTSPSGRRRRRSDSTGIHHGRTARGFHKAPARQGNRTRWHSEPGSGESNLT
ncbi:unnamed protein product [Macrosiphum euphorbiae]|uniref:Uncharacterized protein n=1 Tax=Macrosiphum euphorbiae TaxID=13131 RepID=A0AAV0X7C0_9HEMI|nr:unnamed protein product [Macrosiphum euphorbiae]